ncbi:MAG: type III pantothenate kinase [Clostridia bacterium]|nr:type III pantothenate kinase [Clostridia bacterium]
MAVNVGNSRIQLGFFENDRCVLRFQFKIATDINKTSDEYLSLIKALVREQNVSGEPVTASVLSSVVPQLTPVFCDTLLRLTESRPVLVGPGVKTGFPIKTDIPSELGTDMVANASAVLNSDEIKGSAGKASVIVDMGTVTTVSAINRFGEYIGCSLFPGVQISLDALHGRTAQLPNVALSTPPRAIGRNSQESVRSGVILGNAMMLDGFVERFAREMKTSPDKMNLFITGEFAKSMTGICRHEFVLDEDMTLKGLYYIYRNTVSASSN